MGGAPAASTMRHRLILPIGNEGKMHMRMRNGRLWRVFLSAKVSYKHCPPPPTFMQHLIRGVVREHLLHTNGPSRRGAATRDAPQEAQKKILLKHAMAGVATQQAAQPPHANWIEGTHLCCSHSDQTKVRAHQHQQQCRLFWLFARLSMASRSLRLSSLSFHLLWVCQVPAWLNGRVCWTFRGRSGPNSHSFAVLPFTC